MWLGWGALAQGDPGRNPKPLAATFGGLMGGGPFQVHHTAAGGKCCSVESHEICEPLKD